MQHSCGLRSCDTVSLQHFTGSCEDFSTSAEKHFPRWRLLKHNMVFKNRQQWMAPTHFFPPPQKCVFSKTAHIRCCQFKKTSNTIYNFINSEFSERLRDLDVITLFSQVYDDGKFLNALVCWGLWLAHVLNENENILSGTKKHMERGGKEGQKTNAVPKQYREIKQPKTSGLLKACDDSCELCMKSEKMLMSMGFTK